MLNNFLMRDIAKKIDIIEKKHQKQHYRLLF